MKKRLQILCVFSLMIGLFITAKPIHAEETTVVRIFGENRYETAYEVADTLKGVLGVEKFDTVIIANGTNFADALAGSYLAAKRNAPIIMASNNRKINDVTLNYIYANVNDGGTVYILGGYNALPMSLDGSLAAYNVVRLAGADRYETNIKILQEAGIANEPLLVATGKGFADSLSASATGLPILLVDKTINEQQKDFLHSLTLNNVYIIGGTSAVSNEVESEMYKLVDKPIRLAGNNRYETSVQVAKTFVQEPKQAVLAYGKNFPDGLSGGVLAYVIASPLLLTENKQANTIATYTKEVGITSGYVLGGTGLISENTKEIVFFIQNIIEEYSKPVYGTVSFENENAKQGEYFWETAQITYTRTETGWQTSISGSGAKVEGFADFAFNAFPKPSKDEYKVGESISKRLWIYLGE